MDQNSCQKVWENGEDATWEDMTSSEEWTEKEIWCRKCSGNARQRMGPKMVNCCRPEQLGTKEFGKTMKRVQTLEEGRVPVKEAKKWRMEEEKRRITREEYKRLLNNFEIEGLMVQKGLWNFGNRKNNEEKR